MGHVRTGCPRIFSSFFSVPASLTAPPSVFRRTPRYYHTRILIDYLLKFEVASSSGDSLYLIAQAAYRLYLVEYLPARLPACLYF